jgi:hypothetical protein
MNYIEKMICGKLFDALCIAPGISGEVITICGERGYDPDATRIKAVPATAADMLKDADRYDEVHVFVGGDIEEGYGPYVYLIFGNGNGGWDVISDYSTSLEPVLQPILDFIEKEGDR